jgi:hypothetical protein
MPLSTQERQAIIGDLTSNCDCWKTAGGRQALEGMPDDVLAAVKADNDSAAETTQIANAAVEGFTDPNSGMTYRLDPEVQRWARKPVGNAPKKAGASAGTGEDDDEEDEDTRRTGKENDRRMKGDGPSASHAPKRNRAQTPDEILNALPPEVQQEVQTAHQIVNREKERVVSQILQNSGLAENQWPSWRPALMQKGLEDLQAQLALQPKAPTVDPSVNAHRGGKAAARRRQPASEDDDALLLPTMNYNTPDGLQPPSEKKNGQSAGSQEDFVDNYDEETDDEFENLSPRARARLARLQAVENREKAEIIDRLVANLDGRRGDGQCG